MKSKCCFLATLLVVIAFYTDIEITVDAAETDYVMQQSLTAEDVPPDMFDESLARLPRVQRGDLDTIGRDAFDTYVRPGTGYETGLRGPIGMWMHSPELAEAMFDVRQRVRYGSEKDQRLTELTIIAAAREIDSQYIYTAHEPAAKNSGLEQGIIDIVRFRKSLDEVTETNGLGEPEETIIRFTREVISEEKVSSATFAKAIELFGNEGVVDLTSLIGYYSFVSLTLKAFDVQRPIGSDLLLPIRIEEIDRVH